MGDLSRPGKKKGLFFRKNWSPIFWTIFALILLSFVPALVSLWPEKGQESRTIPLDALSKIQREKANAQKDYEEFIKTPTGKIWEKHPFWDRETCQKIAQGQLFPGMSKEQAKAAIGPPKKIRTAKRGEILHEEWAVEGKEKITLKFEDNVLKSVERK